MTFTKKYKTFCTLLCIQSAPGITKGRRYRCVRYYPNSHTLKMINAQGREHYYNPKFFRLWEKISR